MDMSYAEIVATARNDERRLIDVEHRGDHAIVRMADAAKRNVLSAALMVQLLDATSELDRDPDIRAVVLTGSGQAFCAGGDLRLMGDQVQRQQDPDDTEGATLPWQWIRNQFGAMARLIAHSDKAFVAAINGSAAGVGLAFALTCDLAIAAEDAVLVPAFGRLGLVPEVGTSWALTRALGYRQAFACYVGGTHIDAAEALRRGLVNEVVVAERLLDVATQWCTRIAALPPHAVPIAKPLLRAGNDVPWEQSLTLEEFAEPMCFTTRGFRDGVRGVSVETSGNQA